MARGLGDKLMRADPQYTRSREVVLEALTMALENVPGVRGRGYESERCGVLRHSGGMPYTWRQLGRHLVNHLGESTVKKAIFQADKLALQQLNKYVDELIQQYLSKT